MINSKISVKLPANQKSGYDVCMDSHLLNKTNWIPGKYHQIIIITDQKVKNIYGNILLKNLKKAFPNVSLISFPAGEKYKNINIKHKLEEKMLKQSCGRDTLVLALGGGVVGDLAGFIAATYMRGIDYIQIPTTLLAMVDSSIGGKTGIDTSFGKNLIGAFWQPKAVISDLQCLKTLPKKHLINGLMEALKVFLIQDRKSFNYLQNNIPKILNYDIQVLTQIVKKAAKNKIDVIQKDERESNLRMILNFGHTMGHALELVDDYKILHGFAVGYGILIEAKMAELLGVLSSKNYLWIESTLNKLNIKGSDLKKWNINKIISATSSDKKAKAGKTYFILLKDIGVVHKIKGNVAHTVSTDIIKQAFNEVIGAHHGR